MRTIRVTGKGQVRLRPDMTRITLSLEGVCPDYGETLHRSAESAEELRELLSAFGFQRSDLKTLSFDVDTEYESYEDNGRYQQRFVGYRFRHAMKVEFPSDNDRLGKLLYALANCPAKPEFRISYTVSDPESAKNELLAKAVADAAAKAAVLTQAAGVTLKELESIDYAWGELDLTVQPMGRMLAANERMAMPMAAKASYDMDIEPDDIAVSDTVTVVWSIT